MMLAYQRINQVDDELYHFCLKQKTYYQLEQQTVTKESLQADMQGPKHCDPSFHFHIKIYQNTQMIGYIDYQYGYRFQSDVDMNYVWIGLFLIDEDVQRLGLGQEIIHHFFEEYLKTCQHVQLACLQNNSTGLAFWKAMGFHQIATSPWNDLQVIVLQYDFLSKENDS